MGGVFQVTARPADTGSADAGEGLLPAVSGRRVFGRPIRRPRHRGTGWQLACANVFSAAYLYDPAGPVIGIDQGSGRAFTFDPWELYHRRLVSSPNVLVEGSLRQGKSFLVKRLLTYLVLAGRRAMNVSDAKGEHGRLAVALGGEVFQLGRFTDPVRINPLDAPARWVDEPEAAYLARVHAGRMQVLTQMLGLLLPEGRQVSAGEVAAIDQILTDTLHRTDRPTLQSMWDTCQAAVDAAGCVAVADLAVPVNVFDVLAVFRRLARGDLAGMFDTHSNVRLRAESPYTVIDTSLVAARGSSTLALTQAVTGAWVHTVLASKDNTARGRNYVLIREEGWRDMRTVTALETHQEQLKLSGEYGIAMVMIVHEGGDFDAVGAAGSKERELAASLLRGYANRICFYQNEATCRRMVEAGSYTAEEAAAVGGLSRGRFLVKTRTGSYLVDGNPTTTGFERDLFYTDSSMTGDRA